MADILILGGSGFVGASLCERLVERGRGGGRITVPSRHASRAAYIRPLPTVEVVDADLHDDAQLARLVRGRDAVVNLVAQLHGSEAAFRHLHVELPRRLAQACREAGVRRIVHVSALGASASAPSRYLRSKAAGEAALQGAGIDLTVLRPSVIYGERDRFLNLFARLQAVFPVVPLAGAQARFQPVWVEDVASAIARCLDDPTTIDPTTIGQTIECAGPRELTLRELVERAGRWSGHPRPVFGLPAPLATLQALLLEALPGEPLMSRDNLASMRVANVAGGTLPGLARLGIVAADIDAVAPTWLDPRRGIARLETWRARARRL